MIDSTANYAQIVAEYADTSPPFDSAEQCRRFIRAASLLIAQPEEINTREGGQRFDKSIIARQLDDAKDELRTIEGTTDTRPRRTRVTRPDFQNFRG